MSVTNFTTTPQPIILRVISSSLTTLFRDVATTTTAYNDTGNETNITSTTTEAPIMAVIRDAEQRATLHGDTAFVILSAALVFFMTPGLGYFYSGMARSKNALSLIFICFLCMAVVLIQVMKY